MGINKVEYGNNTLIDLTNDTVTPEKIFSGYTAHDKTGEIIIGIAPGQIDIIRTEDAFDLNYDNLEGFLLSYNSTPPMYMTNTFIASSGILEEVEEKKDASVWFFEKIEGTKEYYIYSIIDNQKYYIYNDTTVNTNFLGFDTVPKNSFTLAKVPNEARFKIKVATANKWLQHSKSGGGIRFFTHSNDTTNAQFIITYVENPIVPAGTLTITENGTYDISNYKTVIVNIS